MTLFVLLLAQFDEGFQQSMIWPFMVQSTLEDAASLGLYVGILASSCFFMQAVSVFV
jgi:hypothetical protein